MKKYKHKKLGWVVKDLVGSVYYLNKSYGYENISFPKELIEDSNDREEIKEPVICDNGITENGQGEGSQKIGFNFETQKKADRRYAKQKAEYRIRKRKAENDIGVVDWKDIDQPKFFAMYDYDDEQLIYDYIHIKKQNNIYFANENIFNKAIKELKEDFIIYLKD